MMNSRTRKKINYYRNIIVSRKPDVIFCRPTMGCCGFGFWFQDFKGVRFDDESGGMKPVFHSRPDP